MRDFRFTEDQRAFQAGVRDYLAKECTAEDVRAAASATTDDARWKGLADLGVVGLTVPEEHGGLGMSFLDLILILEEAGAAALPEPLLEVTAIAAPLLASVADVEGVGDLLGHTASGARRPVAVVESLQPHASAADTYLLWTDEGDLVAGGNVALAEERALDGARPVAEVLPAGAHDATLATGTEARRLRDLARARGAVGAAAMLVGLSSRMIELAVDYAQQRTQFGAPIGSFQAVKHHLSNALVQVEFARPAVYRAAWSLTHRPDDPATAAHASMAKVLAGDAATFTAKAALQVHGAIGYTHEHNLHLWMQRAWALETSYGSTDDHRAALRRHVLG